MAELQPLVSVVIPLHNGQRYVRQAIESALDQGVAPLEVIVVDDASTDGSPGTVRRYGERVRYIRVEKQPSSMATTNVGLETAAGKYIAVLHQDDYFLPGKLLRHVAQMERDPSIGFAYSGQWFVGPRGEPLSKLRSPLRRGDYVVDGVVEMRHLAVQNFLNFCNVVVRRSAMQQVGLLHDQLWVIADWGMWLRLALRNRVAYIDELLVCYRIHGGAQTLTRTQQPQEWERQVRIVIDELFAEPDLPRAVRERRPLTEASLQLSVALLSGLRRDWREAWHSGRSVVRLVGWRQMPGFVHSSSVVPRLLPRAKVIRLQHAEDSSTMAGDPELLRCAHCGAIAGYPASAARSNGTAPAGQRGLRMRCLACGFSWTAGPPSEAKAEAGPEGSATQEPPRRIVIRNE